jgi:hypothetical protein
VWRDVPGKPAIGSSATAPSDRNSGWISWLWPKPISDTMSRNAWRGAQSLQSLHCSTS